MAPLTQNAKRRKWGSRGQRLRNQRTICPLEDNHTPPTMAPMGGIGTEVHPFMEGKSCCHGHVVHDVLSATGDALTGAKSVGQHPQLSSLMLAT